MLLYAKCISISIIICVCATNTLSVTYHNQECTQCCASFISVLCVTVGLAVLSDHLSRHSGAEVVLFKVMQTFFTPLPSTVSKIKFRS